MLKHMFNNVNTCFKHVLTCYVWHPACDNTTTNTTSNSSINTYSNNISIASKITAIRAAPFSAESTNTGRAKPATGNNTIISSIRFITSLKLWRPRGLLEAASKMVPNKAPKDQLSQSISGTYSAQGLVQTRNHRPFF